MPASNAYMREYMRRWRKGRKLTPEQRELARARNARYRKTEKGKANKRRFEQSEKGRRAQQRKGALRRNRSTFAKNLIQMVYEDNIKRYGTLTCYLCGLSVEFGNDHLEHKVPLSKGGKHEYCNLEVACSYCNLSKGSKDLEDFLSKTLKSGKTLNCKQGEK